MGQFNLYTQANSIDGTNDLFLKYENSTGVLKTINRNTIMGVTGSPADISTAQSFTNKTIGNTNAITVKDNSFTLQNSSDTTKQATFSLSGITTGNIRTLTLQDASGTVPLLGATQTWSGVNTFSGSSWTGGTIANPTLTVDSVAGYTTSNSGTIYGIGVTSGVITGSATVSSAALGQNVIPSTLVSGTGSSWSWQAWTPTLSNITIGNGTVLAKYIQIGKSIFIQIVITLGSTSSMGTSPAFTLPVTASSDFAVNQMFGTGTLGHAGSGYIAWGYLNSNTVCRVVTTGTAPILANITATSPFTWANGDFIQLTGTYEAA